MLSKFLNLSQEKRERIINAALMEFVKKGYKNASTNEIVKEANISKGLLFHYFENKIGLFLYLYDYSCETVLNACYGRFNLIETDLFERLIQFAAFKLEIIKKYPMMYQFLIKAAIDGSPEVKKELEARSLSMLEDFGRKIYTGFDTSKFRDGIDIQSAISITVWTGEGLSNRELARIKNDPSYVLDVDKSTSEYYGYIEQLKKCFYK